MAIYAAVLTALLVTLVDTQLCPPNWDYWGSNCYFFDTDTALEAPTYWHGAVSRCSNIAALYGYNATLPSIHSEDENMFIWGTIMNRYGYPDATRYDAWIGLIGELDGSYSWIDGTDVVYTRWGTDAPRWEGKPNNCVRMDFEENINVYAYWQDSYACDGAGWLHLACKGSTERVTPPPAECPPFWLSWGDHCYYISYSQTEIIISWDQAQSFCAQKSDSKFNVTIASIHSEAENKFINDTTRLLNIEARTWIGLMQTSADEPFESWADGSALQYANWDTNQPRYDSDLQCVYMASFKDITGVWLTWDCTGTSDMATVCKTPKASV